VGFESANGDFADLSWFSIVLVRLAFTPAHLTGFGPDLGPIVPKLFLISSYPTQQNSSKGHLRVLTRNGSSEQRFRNWLGLTLSLQVS
jgi:hypothetical protein